MVARAGRSGLMAVGSLLAEKSGILKQARARVVEALLGLLEQLEAPELQVLVQETLTMVAIEMLLEESRHTRMAVAHLLEVERERMCMCQYIQEVHLRVELLAHRIMHKEM